MWEPRQINTPSLTCEGPLPCVDLPQQDSECVAVHLGGDLGASLEQLGRKVGHGA